jgi:WD40 repeat protein
LEKGSLKQLSRVAAAHTDLINAVAANPFSTNNIVTAANDGKVLTWDLRKTNIDGNVSQSCIYEDLSLKPTCLQFLPSNENYLLVGNQGGEIQLFDIRKPTDCITKNTQMDKSISKLKFAPQDPKMFGVCSESTPLKIMQIDEKLASIDVRYEDSRHEDFVRDVVWKPDAASKRLFSCGWDHKVLTHNL